VTTTVETDKRGPATERTWAPGEEGVKAAVCQHIAIAVQDPGGTAAFYHEVFGLPEVRRVTEPYAEGIVLTDGFVELGFYKFTESYLQSHNEVPGRSYKPGFTGFHHLAFSTTDALRIQEMLEVEGRHHGGDADQTGDPALNPQWIGTDKLLFALSDKRWTERKSLGPDVARIRHIGIASQDPYSTTRFFRDALGMRTTDKYMVYGGFADGFAGSDGNIEYALLRFNEPYQHAHDDSRGFEIGFAGIHHIGYFVTDLEKTHSLLAQHNCKENMAIREFLTTNNRNQYVVEEKYDGPDHTSFEVNGVDWKVRPLEGA
jgi:catechol 2,3-dioxygenase-like lactoylglutathione lyase family enzyme